MDTQTRFHVGTAQWTAAARAKETQRVDRLFADPFADALPGAVGGAALEASERAIGGENPYLPIRTRWFDDLVLREAREGWQVVGLGAGFDTRAIRLSMPNSVKWFELDHETTFGSKEPLLLAAGAIPGCTRICVPADLAGPWGQSLLDAGFEPGLATLWLAEGLLMYLDGEAVDRLLLEARSLSAARTVFAADLFSTPIAARGGAPRFATSDPAGLFRRVGWSPTVLAEPWELPYALGRLAAIERAGASPVFGRAWFATAEAR